MDRFIDERDLALLDSDKYSFFVLRRIITGDCQFIASNHLDCIICYSTAPYPVWIYTADDMKTDDMKRVYDTVKEYGFLSGEYSFILKYDLAQFFIEKAKSEGDNYLIKVNMYAYNAPELIEPVDKTDGYLCKAKIEDLDELLEMTYLFHEEIGTDQKSMDQHREDLISLIKEEKVYLWKNVSGENVACCRYYIVDDCASISLVYTKEKYRRMHYGENMIYELCKIIKQEGYMPTLYTDADYTASNACYQKVGFVLQGKLCTIEPIKTI